MNKFSLNDAVQKHLSGDLKTAERMYQAVLEGHPNAFEPFFYMASLKTQQNKITDAIVYLHRAAELSDNAVIFNNLGSLYRRLNQTEIAKEVLLRGLKNPGRLEADLCNNIGTTFVNEGNPDDGEGYLRRAIEIEPTHPQAHWNLGLVMLEKRQWEEGWQNYHYGTYSTERIGRWPAYKQWNKEVGKVVIYGEQGLGDEIMFSSMLPDAISTGADVILECHPRLEQTFKRSFPEVQVFPTRKLEIADIPDFEYRTAIGDLGMLFRNSDESFPRLPYLRMHTKLVQETKAGYEKYPKPWIGIGWKGGYTKTRKDLRSLPLEAWTPILQASQGTFFSFQYDVGADSEIEKYCKENPRINLYHFPSIARADNYDVVLTHLNCMDVVLHVNGTGVHACGALGTPCYTLTPSRPAWRYSIAGDDMPFYGENVKQIRQVGDDWESLIDKVAQKVSDNDFPKRLR